MNHITNVLVISMYHRKERWEKFREMLDQRIKRYRGVDTRTMFKAGSRLNGSGFDLNPVDEENVLYFSQAPGAVGCFLSHIEIWRRVIEGKNKLTLIVEDDANPVDIREAITIDHDTNRGYLGDYHNYDAVQLNQRTPSIENLNGTEAYLLTLTGAKKLYEAAHNTAAFDFPSLADHKPLSIWTAVDKFIGKCTTESISADLRLTCTCKPRVRLADRHDSDIMTANIPFWTMPTNDLEKFKNSSQYKWWC